MNSTEKLARRKNFILVNLIFFVNFFWYWKKAFFNPSGLLPGDNADARYTTSLYEHWHLFFTGNLKLTENYFFYPIQNSMSFSDAYLLQGMFHSIFRFGGIEIVNAWLYSSMLIHLIGSYSAVLISHRLKLNIIASSALITFRGFNSVIWVQRGHIQNLAYPLIGYVLLHFINNRQSTKRKIIIWRCITFNFLILIGLSSAYPFVFTILYAFIGIVTLTFLKKNWRIGFILELRKTPRTQIKKLLLKAKASNNVIPLISTIPLTYLFSYVYLISANTITTRSPAEASYYSPTFSELLESPPFNPVYGKITSSLFANSFPPTGERYMGFTPLFLFLFLFASWRVWLKYRSDKNNFNLTIWVLALTVIIAEVLVLRDGRGFNFWYLTGSRLPFFDAIRGMSRIHQTQYMLGGLLIAIYLNKSLNIEKVKRNFSFLTGMVLIVVISAFLVLQESNSYYGSWKSSEMTPISSDLRIPNFCESFIIIPTAPMFATRPWYLYLIDAQIIATNSKIPTYTGYSGGIPEGYNIDFSTEGTAQQSSLEYVEKFNKPNTCLVKLQKNDTKIDWNISRYER